MNLKWMPYDTDAFMIETKESNYYYALKSALMGRGDHYYKIYKDKSLGMEEVNQSEIVDIIQNQPDSIIAKCPCIKIIDGKIQPLFSKPEKEKPEYICACGHKVDVYVPQTPGIDIRIKHPMHFSAYAYHSEICNCRMGEGTVITDSQGKKCFVKANGKWKALQD